MLEDVGSVVDVDTTLPLESVTVVVMEPSAFVVVVVVVFPDELIEFKRLSAAEPPLTALTLIGVLPMSISFDAAVCMPNESFTEDVAPTQTS